jgi:Fur family ferric uptake transcriptional regulator
MDIKIERLLRDHSLRLTQGRADILSVFLNKNVAIAHSHIEEEVDGKYDRVTIYRTLKSFLSKGIIHKVIDDSGVMHYALCDESCSESDHQHDHIHFKCTSCGNTLCLDHVHIPKVELPKGFVFGESNYLISGTCQSCNKAG